MTIEDAIRKWRNSGQVTPKQAIDKLVTENMMTKSAASKLVFSIWDE